MTSPIPGGQPDEVGALIVEALAEQEPQGSLDEVLAAMDREYGPPGPEAVEWARRVLGP